MAVSASVVSVGTSATQLTASNNAGDGIYGGSVVLQPAATVYIGDATVTTGTGFPLAGGNQLAVDLQPGEVLYGIVGSGAASVNVLQVGV